MAASLPANYDDSHRAFMQALMARGTLTVEEAQPILAAILTIREGGERQVQPQEVTPQIFDSYMNMAADALSLVDYEVRNTLHQVTRKRIWAVVNTTSDPSTQLATTYTPDEISFIKRVLDAVFESYNSPRMEALCINEMQAIKLRKPTQRNTQAGAEESQSQGDKGLKTSDVEKVLSGLVSEGWFEKSRAGFYSLSPRALMELRSWLVNSYNDPDAGADEWQRVKFCVACKEVITIGQRCAERDCNVRLHDICQDAFWRSRDKKCPKCATPWNGKQFVGERAITTTEAYQRGRRKSGPRSSNLADEVMQQTQDEDVAKQEDGDSD
jgi:non-structural maintenance of chromosomes element 1